MWLRVLCGTVQDSRISHGTLEIPKKNVLQSGVTRSVAKKTGHLVNFCIVWSLGYVRERTEFEGLLPQLMPRSNLKFCICSLLQNGRSRGERTRQHKGLRNIILTCDWSKQGKPKPWLWKSCPPLGLGVWSDLFCPFCGLFVILENTPFPLHVHIVLVGQLKQNAMGYSRARTIPIGQTPKKPFPLSTMQNTKDHERISWKCRFGFSGNHCRQDTSGADPGFLSGGGPTEFGPQRVALSLRFAQNRGLSLKIAQNLYDFVEIMGASGVPAPRALLDPPLHLVHAGMCALSMQDKENTTQTQGRKATNKQTPVCLSLQALHSLTDP